MKGQVWSILCVWWMLLSLSLSGPVVLLLPPTRIRDIPLTPLVHVRVAGKDEACVCRTPRKLLVYLLHTLVISHESSMTTITRDSVLSEMLSHSIKWSGTCMLIPFSWLYGLFFSLRKQLGRSPYWNGFMLRTTEAHRIALSAWIEWSCISEGIFGMDGWASGGTLALLYSLCVQLALPRDAIPIRIAIATRPTRKLVYVWN
jgi:hypothetical protein